MSDSVAADPSLQPALPWGVAPAPHDTDQTEPIEVDLPAKLALPKGVRLEVKWEIENDEEEGGVSVKTKWWGARLDGQVRGKKDGEGRHAYCLIYDAEEGFEAEQRTVTFLDEHTLYDLTDDEELYWRKEGDEWEAPEEDEEGEEGEEGSGTEATVRLAEVAAAIRQAEKRRGRTVEEDCLELVKDLPPSQQRFMISGWSDYAQFVSAGLKALFEEKGPGYVVNAKDVAQISFQAMEHQDEQKRKRFKGSAP